EPQNLNHILDNFTMVKAADFDICLLGSSDKEFGFMHDIHIWLTPSDINNSSLMILIGYIIMGHRDWRDAEIRIFAVVSKSELSSKEENLVSLIKAGRLPISPNNIKLIQHEEDVNIKDIVNERSQDADLTILGFREEAIKQLEHNLFEGYDDIGNVLFINSSKAKDIE
ncbi:MAG: amino acid permease, partial [Fulvivirga sp.]